MPSYGRTFLKEEEKDKYSRRLTHYLEDYCFKNKITHNQAAEKLGISPNKFSQLKSGGEQGRFLSSLDYLKSIANLQGMTITDFLTYLDAEAQQSRPNYSWQDRIYKALESIAITSRKKFADDLAHAAKDGDDRVELMCRLASAVAGKDIGALRSLVDAMERM